MVVKSLRFQMVTAFDGLNLTGDSTWQTGGVGCKLAQSNLSAEFGLGADGNVLGQILDHGLIQVDYTAGMEHDGKRRCECLGHGCDMIGGLWSGLSARLDVLKP